jgi:hypothetical protein
MSKLCNTYVNADWLCVVDDRTVVIPSERLACNDCMPASVFSAYRNLLDIDGSAVQHNLDAAAAAYLGKRELVSPDSKSSLVVSKGVETVMIPVRQFFPLAVVFLAAAKPALLPSGASCCGSSEARGAVLSILLTHSSCRILT